MSSPPLPPLPESPILFCCLQSIFLADFVQFASCTDVYFSRYVSKTNAYRIKFPSYLNPTLGFNYLFADSLVKLPTVQILFEMKMFPFSVDPGDQLLLQEEASIVWGRAEGHVLRRSPALLPMSAWRMSRESIRP